jgi:hypothetical protein
MRTAFAAHSRHFAGTGEVRSSTVAVMDGAGGSDTVSDEVLIYTSRVPRWRQVPGRDRWSLLRHNGIVTLLAAGALLAVAVPCLVSGWLVPEMLGTVGVPAAGIVALYGMFLVGRRIVHGRPALSYVVTASGFETSFGEQTRRFRFDEFVRAEWTSRGWLLHRAEGKPWLMMRLAFGPRDEERLRQILTARGLLGDGADARTAPTDDP